MNRLPAACAALLGAPALSPWLDPYRRRGAEVARGVQGGASVAVALNLVLADDPIELCAGQLLSFAPADDAPAAVPYEAHIAATGRVPTRDNAHDLYNGLVWRRFPRLKRRLNALQAGAIASGARGPTRGALRDALTLFDENAALLQAPEVLRQALARRDWRALFVTHRDAWRDAAFVVFGHALLEKLLQPRKPITAHVWSLPREVDLQDAVLAELEVPQLTDRRWHPLPVLGVPGWWSENADPRYYDDAAVFRLPRPRAAASLR